jgi:anti-sigma factor RsiW
MLLRGSRAPGCTERAMTLLAQEAVASHAVYAADRGRPIDVPGSEKSELAPWLLGWPKRTVALPDLPAAAYHLIGGRLLVTERGGAAALLIEDDGGHRFSVLLRSMVPDPNASMTTTGQDHLAVEAWTT